MRKKIISVVVLIAVFSAGVVSACIFYWRQNCREVCEASNVVRAFITAQKTEKEKYLTGTALKSFDSRKPDSMIVTDINTSVVCCSKEWAVVDADVTFAGSRTDRQKYRFYLRMLNGWRIYKVERTCFIPERITNKKCTAGAKDAVSGYIRAVAERKKEKARRMLVGPAYAATVGKLGELPEISVENLRLSGLGCSKDICLVEAIYIVKADFYEHPQKMRQIFTVAKAGREWRIAAVDLVEQKEGG